MRRYMVNETLSWFSPKRTAEKRERDRIDQTCLNVSTLLTTWSLSHTLMCIKSYARGAPYRKCTPSRLLSGAESTFSMRILKKIFCILRSWAVFRTQLIIQSSPQKQLPTQLTVFLFQVYRGGSTLCHIPTQKILFTSLEQLQTALRILDALLFLIGCEQTRHPLRKQLTHPQRFVQNCKHTLREIGFGSCAHST